MDGEGQRGAYAQHGSEGVGAGAQMGYLAQEFERMSLLLQRIGGRIGGAEHFERLGLHLAALAASLRLHQKAFHMDGRAGGDRAQVVVGEERHVEDYLHRTDG